jgi:hypothetical protein
MAGLMNDVTKTATGAIGNLSQNQKDVLANAPDEMKPFLEAQMKMQKEQELVQFITQMMKQMHEMAMSVIRNIGG